MESEWIIHVLVGLWVVLKLEQNPLHPRTPLAKSVGLFLFHIPLLEPPFLLFFFLSFCSNFSTASSSASDISSSLAFATTSSLASSQYSIQENYVTILI